MGALKAVGLLSGGKDSIFAMHYARELGHSICAVATLLPRGDAIETDSYMYQSVGTHMTAAIAECLGVPHFSAQVNGQPILTETLNYKHTAGDEVEDLCALLLRVKTRTTVEAVKAEGGAGGPGERKQSSSSETLLREMVNWGLHAVLVKTASMGLTRKHLGHTISDLLPYFVSLNRQYDFHICGEGGEYETLTLDCPLFEKGSIEVSNWQPICHSDDPVAPVWLLSPTEWRVVPKSCARIAHPLAANTASAPMRLHALERGRFEPYQDNIRHAVSIWGSEEDADSAQTASLSEPLDVLLGWRKNSKWNLQVQSSSSGCIVSADVCEESADADVSLDGSTATEPRDFVAELLKSLSSSLQEWLDDQLRTMRRNSRSAHPVQTICQVCSLELSRTVENVFISRRAVPHPMTFFVTSLPRRVALRLAIVWSLSEGSGPSLDAFFNYPGDNGMLHVHSQNLWVPPCDEGEANGSQDHSLERSCCTCQGLRCELASNWHPGVSHVFIRGIDGSFPFSGRLPDMISNPSLRALAGELGELRKSDQGLHVALQAASSFVNVQHALHLCKVGGANRGLPHMFGAPATSEALKDTQRLPIDVPSCILAFVKLEKPVTESASTAEMPGRSDRKLEAVKHLLHGLLDSSKTRSAHLRVNTQSATQTIVVVVEVSDLPRGAKVMVLPLWEVAFQSSETPFSRSCSIQELHHRGDTYSATVTTLKICPGISHDREVTSKTADSGVSSCLMCISFQQSNCTGSSTLESFWGQLDKTLTLSLGKEMGTAQFLGLTDFNNSKRPTTGHGNKRIHDIYVFYSRPFACSFGVDLKFFEENCRRRIVAALSGTASATSELPLVIFIPVVNIEGGFLKIVACSI
ncbi:YLR143W-like protein, related [Eimeria necatrix]|uniref:Diphthine--ammonia ligase n=1 Tax=Eimeria necatrix TaxID=51315 RepID=U6MTI1_9EIME|nr:YLR143W-like protein, related [Eimeria necatrix]CDJ64975.1 YLR143W-like protein, related [Eimeria necatrix]